MGILVSGLWFNLLEKKNVRNINIDRKWFQEIEPFMEINKHEFHDLTS
jgi:hypothetical protein